jgi:hypothetical protein
MPRKTKKNRGHARRRSDSLSLSNSNSNSNSNNSPINPNNLERDPISHLRIRIPPRTHNILALSPHVAPPIVLSAPRKPPSPVSRLALALPTPRLKRGKAAAAARAPIALLLPPPSNTAGEGDISYPLGADSSPPIPPPSYGYSAEQRAALAQLREQEIEESMMAELGRMERLSKKKGGSTRKTRRSRTRK